MKIAVRYFSKSGNTKKLADAIAAELGVEAKDVSQPLGEKAELLFICNSMYWAGIDKSVRSFIRANADKIGTMVNVSTAALAESTFGRMRKLAAEEGVKLSGSEFHCRGSFHALHAGHPDEADLSAAKAFAKKVAGT